MPAKDKIHDALVAALEKDGWTITNDPYFVRVGKRKAFVDLAADKIIAATKENQKIAVEGKSFIGSSELTEFERALGQYGIYILAIEEKEPDRVLDVGMPQEFYEDFMQDPFFQKVARFHALNIIVFDEIKEEIIRWINS